MQGITEQTERNIYRIICSHDGIKAKEIAKIAGLDRTTVNRYLYNAPFMRELCYRDTDYLWHGMVRQHRPHTGLGEFCGYYGTVREFLCLTPEEWLESLKEGCRRVGRNLNDTRGLIHSFTDCHEVMAGLFEDLALIGTDDWEIVFELRINKSRRVRIYADVLVITEDKVFSLEFKMKDVIEESELVQAAKYVPYQEVLFGPDYDVIPVLVLTGAGEYYDHALLPGSTAQVPVCSGDMLFNVFDEYIGFLEE